MDPSVDPPSCDPALFSCITTEELQFILPFVMISLGAFLIWRLIRSELRRHHNGPPTRGTEPGQGQSVTFVNMPSHGRGRDHLITIRHTKDPQAHARSMMPSKARRKDDNP